MLHCYVTDCLIVAVRPKAPPKHIRSGDDEDDEDEDDLKFQLPESTSRWKWRLFVFYMINIVLIALFSLSFKAWIFIILWFILAPVAHRWDLGPLFILGTGFFIIFWNLGHRKTGELSAYSIFNEDFRELPGTLNADRLDRDLRTGQL
ncbi:SAYSvFN domain-containing protein 1 [Bienertia sinuspersici]